MAMATGMRIANAPVSWGVLEFEGMETRPIGYAELLDELAGTGYIGTELGEWGFLPTDPALLAEELAARGLAMLGAFVPVNLRDPHAHEAGIEEAVRIAGLLAAVATEASRPGPFIVLSDDNAADPVRALHAGRVRPEHALPAEEWEHFVRGVDQIARAVRDETGLPMVFHHHSAGFVETPEETRRFLADTDPELVGLVFDTGHFAFGAGPEGMTPHEAVEEFGPRIRHVHFKDLSPAVAARSRDEEWDYFTALHHGVFPELGTGLVDFAAVLDALRAIGYEGWIVVEQDVLPGMGTPRESAQRNREYLRSLGV